MEAKTIGTFIAALRRANGMTQKELAELLNVSDKTVSRWECDDSAPDLSLIPVVAEVFGVTCDELLRGERAPHSGADVQNNAAESQELSPPLSKKAEKQAKYLLQSVRMTYSIQSIVTVLIVVIGLIAAMIANTVFHRAYLGMLLGTVICIIAVSCQAIFTVIANFTSSSDLFGGNLLSDTERGSFRYWIWRTAMRNTVLALLAFAFTLPLAIFAPDAHVGLSVSSWFPYGLMFVLIAVIFALIFCWIARHLFLKKNGDLLDEHTIAVTRHNHTLQKKIFLIMAGIVCLTAILHLILSAAQDPAAFAEPLVFDDLDTFAAYMAEDIPYTVNNGMFGVEEAPVQVPADPTAMYPEFPIYYDKNGNIISEEEALTRHFYDKDGNVIFSYIARNESVAHIRHNGDDITPISVVTFDALKEGQTTLLLINAVFVVIYAMECFVGILVYFLKRKI